MLTRQQYRLLMFVHDRLQETGVSPSYDEIKDAMELKSKSGIHRLVTSLEERGYLRRLAHRARALEVTRLPKNVAPGCAPIRNRKVETIRRQGLIAHYPTQTFTDNGIQVQLYGRIAAGTPIEALRDTAAMVEIPSTMLGRKNCYALEVEGDSMKDAGILDGDTVIVEHAESARNGEIVVALVREQEVTLKRLRDEESGRHIVLEPANDAHPRQTYKRSEVRIQGRMIGLLRHYHTWSQSS